ncbi:MAG: Crp/Fnr family transcriptional regulator [Gammaproteobacteria bacterium]|nr:Crp/Fnr family transcriptional regulator [Gammaproteobacteria bacterium]MDH3428364.1 Crp/Fnr family transcriptional regulator [Gammaproteobacteria bacterium]
MNADTRDYDIVGIIARSPWFADLPAKARQRLVEAARIRSYRKHSYLYTTGEKSTEIYCILSGRVRMLLTSAIGQEYAVTDYDPGTWLGGEFLSGDNPARLDAQINETTTVLTLPRNLVLDLAEQHPGIFKHLFTDYMFRLSGIVLLLQGMAFYPLRARLAGWFVELIEKHGTQSDGKLYLDVHLSQNDLAQLSLGSRQRINKILGEWRERGIVEMQGSRYLIRDMNALVQEMELKDDDN